MFHSHKAKSGHCRPPLPREGLHSGPYEGKQHSRHLAWKQRYQSYSGLAVPGGGVARVTYHENRNTLFSRWRAETKLLGLRHELAFRADDLECEDRFNTQQLWTRYNL